MRLNNRDIIVKVEKGNNNNFYSYVVSPFPMYIKICYARDERNEFY
jgi:hypothetical protein